MNRLLILKALIISLVVLCAPAIGQIDPSEKCPAKLKDGGFSGPYCNLLSYGGGAVSYQDGDCGTKLPAGLQAEA